MSTPINTSPLSILLPQWPKSAPSNVQYHEYYQQQFEFADKKGRHGVFTVFEVMTYSRDGEKKEKCSFPSFYRNHLGRLLHRRALYTELWAMYDNPRCKAFPKFNVILKRIKQQTIYLDNVVEKCLEEAQEARVTPEWSPTILQSWLLVEYYVNAHDPDSVRAWIEENEEVNDTDPAEFGKHNAFCVLISFADRQPRLGES